MNGQLLGGGSSSLPFPHTVMKAHDDDGGGGGDG